MRLRFKTICRVMLGAALISAMTCGHAAAEDLREVSRAQFQGEVARLEQAVAACKASANGCDAKDVSTDERVRAEGNAPAFVMRWGWLQTALSDAVKAKTDERVKSMGFAEQHLEELAAEIAANAAGDDGFAKAREQASIVLARAEFDRATGPTWWERQMARLGRVLGVLFGGIGALGDYVPWLGTLLEVLFYLGAAVGILFFVRRAFVRQRLAISLSAGAAKAGAWDKEADDWAALADGCAAQQQWREAVHCLYWAAIVRLEARRAWRHNPTRTPREYVRLLKPGSPQQGALRSLTQILERVWYGLREASDEDYQQARSLFDGLSETQQAAMVGNA